jgi:hypothetical protein
MSAVRGASFSGSTKAEQENHHVKHDCAGGSEARGPICVQIPHQKRDLEKAYRRPKPGGPPNVGRIAGQDAYRNNSTELHPMVAE